MRNLLWQHKAREIRLIGSIEGWSFVRKNGINNVNSRAQLNNV